MRNLLTATLFTAGLIAAGSATAQTVTEPAETVVTVETAAEAEASAQVERNSDHQSAWYGKPYALSLIHI